MLELFPGRERPSCEPSYLEDCDFEDLGCCIVSSSLCIAAVSVRPVVPLSVYGYFAFPWLFLCSGEIIVWIACADDSVAQRELAN